MGQYSAVSAEYSVRSGLDVQLFGFGRIVKSAFRCITNDDDDVDRLFHIIIAMYHSLPIAAVVPVGFLFCNYSLLK